MWAYSRTPLIIELVDSISWDETDSPLTQYITNAGISRAMYIHYQVFKTGPSCSTAASRDEYVNLRYIAMLS